MNAKEKARLHEVGDFLWSIAKRFHRDGRQTPLTREEASALKTISSDLHGIAEERPRYEDFDWGPTSNKGGIIVNLNDLRDACYQTSKDHGFHDSPKTVGDDIALMHSELSEAYEDFRAGHAPNESWYEERPIVDDGIAGAIAGAPSVRTTKAIRGDGKLNKPCGIPSEIADVIIRAFDFCGRNNIDIQKAVEEKMAFNRTRPFKHGKVI